MNPGLRYQGSKRKLTEWLFQRIPSGKSFIDLCGGGASVSIAALRLNSYGMVVYNDINGDVVNFFAQCRNSARELAHIIDMTPYSRDEFDIALPLESDSDIEKARKFYIRTIQSFRGTGQQKSCWEISSVQDYTKKWDQSAAKILSFAKSIKRLTIENNDFEKCISLFDGKESIFYADPPYLQDSMSGKSTYAYDMPKYDHIRLFNALDNAEGNCAVSGYPSKLYDKLYKNWKRYDLQYRSALAKSGEQSRIECLWVKNPMDKTNDLFGD